MQAAGGEICQGRGPETTRDKIRAAFAKSRARAKAKARAKPNSSTIPMLSNVHFGKGIDRSLLLGSGRGCKRYIGKDVPKMLTGAQKRYLVPKDRLPAFLHDEGQEHRSYIVDGITKILGPMNIELSIVNMSALGADANYYHRWSVLCPGRTQMYFNRSWTLTVSPLSALKELLEVVWAEHVAQHPGSRCPFDIMALPDIVVIPEVAPPLPPPVYTEETMSALWPARSPSSDSTDSSLGLDSDA